MFLVIILNQPFFYDITLQTTFSITFKDEKYVVVLFIVVYPETCNYNVLVAALLTVLKPITYYYYYIIHIMIFS